MHSTTISFRLKGAMLARLIERARLEGLSAGECSRALVVAALGERRDDSLEPLVRTILDELAEIRSAIRDRTVTR